jgi:excisionase family DNA binding protein
MTASPWLTRDEAIAYLRLGSPSALYRAIREQGLPSRRLGRAYRFDTRELDRWLAGETTVQIRGLDVRPAKRLRAV